VQTGGIAGCHLPSTPQAILLQTLPLQAVAQVIIGMHAVLFFAFFFASDGAAEIAIAITAMAPTSRTFAIDFMMKPPQLNTPETSHGEWAITRSALARGG
jgi:hypothetical protein